jgi:hypothetical protein
MGQSRNPEQRYANPFSDWQSDQAFFRDTLGVVQPQQKFKPAQAYDPWGVTPQPEYKPAPPAIADDNVLALDGKWSKDFKNFDDVIWAKTQKNGREYYEMKGDMYKPLQKVCDNPEDCKREILSDTQLNYVKVALKNRLKMDWYILHKMALNYPEVASYEEQEKAFRKLHAFSWLLPCSIC